MTYTNREGILTGMRSKVFYYGTALDHEKTAINRIRKVLPEENYFILVSTSASNQVSSSEVDVTLICPKGVFLIELKDWSGSIREPLNAQMRYITLVTMDGQSAERRLNPFQQVDTQRKRALGHFRRIMGDDDKELQDKLNIDGGIKGVVSFTHSDFDYEISDIGHLHCLAPEELSQLWDQKFRRDVLSEENIARLLELYGPGEETGVSSKYFEPGHVIGNYTIDKLLYDAINYQVYRATFQLYDQSYFLKVVYVDPGEITQSQKLIERVALRDAQAKAALRREPYVLFSSIPPFIHGSFIVSATEWVDHTNLADRRLQKSSLKDKRELIRMLSQIISSIHEHNVIHRDIDPRNVLITTDGTMRLVNFDFARIGGAQTVGNALTVPTFYRAPELFGRQSAEVDYRVDLYSLGVISHEIITGNVPFKDMTEKVMHPKLRLVASGLKIDRVELLEQAFVQLLSPNVEQRDTGFAQLQEWLREE